LASLTPTPAEHAADVMARAAGQGHLDNGDIEELRSDHTDDEVVAILVDWYSTPAGQTEMAKAGRGGADPRELAKLLMGGR
jgi:hypothetical protein